MGKALSGELSCPCDRSCLTLLHSERPKLCTVYNFGLSECNRVKCLAFFIEGNMHVKFFLTLLHSERPNSMDFWPF